MRSRSSHRRQGVRNVGAKTGAEPLAGLRALTCGAVPGLFLDDPTDGRAEVVGGLAKRLGVADDEWTPGAGRPRDSASAHSEAESR